MTPEAIFKGAEKDGVKLFPGAAGILKARGKHEAVKRWHPIICKHKAEILAFVEQITGPAEQADNLEVVSHWWQFYYPNGNLKDKGGSLLSPRVLDRSTERRTGCHKSRSL